MNENKMWCYGIYRSLRTLNDISQSINTEKRKELKEVITFLEDLNKYMGSGTPEELE